MKCFNHGEPVLWIRGHVLEPKRKEKYREKSFEAHPTDVCGLSEFLLNPLLMVHGKRAGLVKAQYWCFPSTLVLNLVQV